LTRGGLIRVSQRDHVQATFSSPAHRVRSGRLSVDAGPSHPGPTHAIVDATVFSGGSR
jgi:hypothetical protein